MEIFIIGIILAVLFAVSVYELATGYANVRLGFTRYRVSREDQPLAYWGVVCLKLSVALFLVWHTWGSGLEF